MLFVSDMGSWRLEQCLDPPAHLRIANLLPGIAIYDSIVGASTIDRPRYCENRCFLRGTPRLTRACR